MRWLSPRAALILTFTSSILTKVCDHSAEYFIDPYTALDGSLGSAVGSTDFVDDGGCDRNSDCVYQLTTLELQSDIDLMNDAEEEIENTINLSGSNAKQDIK